MLSKGEVDSKKIRVEFSLEDMDMSEFQDGATYPQIKEYVLEHTGLKVSNLYISQIKRKCGIEVGKNYRICIAWSSWSPGICTVYFWNRYSLWKHRRIYRWFYFYGAGLLADCPFLREKTVGRNPCYGYWLSGVLLFWNRVVYDCLRSGKWSRRPCDGSCLVRKIPFIIPDLIKLGLALTLARRLSPVLKLQ